MAKDGIPPGITSQQWQSVADSVKQMDGALKNLSTWTMNLHSVLVMFDACSEHGILYPKARYDSCPMCTCGGTKSKGKKK